MVGNLASGERLEDLSEGKWFKGDELIIESDGRRMTTVHEVPGDEELRTFRYDLKFEDGLAQSITCNGGQNYLPRDEGYAGLITDIEDAKKARTTCPE
ncbi:MAG TPA: hypothetical protein ENH99_00780 [Candidatus Pacearchaeota archaeon]|nr:hypothetical protein [Candidatus Pacearchaeota archaeon]